MTLPREGTWEGDGYGTVRIESDCGHMCDYIDDRDLDACPSCREAAAEEDPRETNPRAARLMARLFCREED